MTDRFSPTVVLLLLILTIAVLAFALFQGVEPGDSGAPPTLHYRSQIIVGATATGTSTNTTESPPAAGGEEDAGILPTDTPPPGETTSPEVSGVGGTGGPRECRLMVVRSSIPLRSGPGPDFGEIATVYAGERGTGRARADGWYQFHAAGLDRTGWVPAEAVDAEAACDALPVSRETICPYDYFFTPNDSLLGRCPAGAASTVEAVYQPFEEGYMLWRADTDLITVVGSDGQPAQFHPEVTEVETDEPPAGQHRPSGVFEAIWLNHEGVRQALGWATGPSTRYSMRTQAVENPDTWLVTLPEGDDVIGYTADSTFVAGTRR